MNHCKKKKKKKKKLVGTPKRFEQGNIDQPRNLTSIYSLKGCRSKIELVGIHKLSYTIESKSRLNGDTKPIENRVQNPSNSGNIDI